MPSKKGQADIISVVLIVVLSMALVSTAYIYGVPLIQKRQDTTIIERVENYFSQTNSNSLPSKIESIANSGGEILFSSSEKGIWNLAPCADKDTDGNYLQGCANSGTNNNSLEFSIVGKVSNVANDVGWVSLTGGTCPPKNGVLGKDKSYVVCAKAESASGGDYKTTYRVWFRQIDDSTGKTSYKISLLQHPSSSLNSAGNDVKIIFANRRQEVSGSKTLIINEIKILLV